MQVLLGMDENRKHRNCFSPRPPRAVVIGWMWLQSAHRHCSVTLSQNWQSDISY